MVQCSQHVIPPAITANLTDRPAHDPELELDVQPHKVLTGRRLGNHPDRSSDRMIDHH
jgi:hypothetical protein